MKKTFFLILLCFIQQAAGSQDHIRISPDLELIRITDNILVHTSYVNIAGYGRSSANGMIFINGKKAFLFDAPWTDSLTAALVNYLEDQLKLHIEGFVPNHWHEDCIGGLGYLKKHGIPSWANQLTIDICNKNGLPCPENPFRDSLKISLGNKKIHCYFPGPAHSIDNIVVWIPSEKVLFPGCIIKSLNSVNLGNTADGDLSEYLPTIDRVINKFKSVVLVVPGHGDIGGPELLLHTKKLASGNQNPEF